MSPPLCELHLDGPTARIRLNHPPLNILTNAMRREMLAHLGRIEAQNGIRVVIFQAAEGCAFSVGSDLKEFPRDETGGRQKIQGEQFLLDCIERLEAITIAQLSGHVLGGGAELMLATDLRIAAEDAQFGFPEVKVGGFPAAGGVWRLVRDLGPLRAKELLLFGRIIGAPAACALGLIQECVPPPALPGRVEERARELLRLPHGSLLAIKRSTAAAAAVPGIADYVTGLYGRLFQGPDLAEGIRAFLEKRPPAFNLPPGPDPANP